MKMIIRIFNIVFIAISAISIILLVSLPTLSVNVGYSMTAEQISQVVPETEQTKDIDIKEAIGGESIGVSLSLSVTPKAIFRSVNGDARTVIDEEFIDPNVAGVINSLRDPIHRVAKGVAKQLLVKVLIEQFETIIDDHRASGDTRTPTAIREAAGLDKNYFNGLADSLFAALEVENATVASVTDVMFDKLQDAVNKLTAATSGMDIPDISEYKTSLQTSITPMLDDLKMLKDDGETLYSFDIIIDAMIVDILRQNGGESAPEGESTEEKAAQLTPMLTKMLKGLFTDEMYNTIALILKIMMFVLVIVIAVWAFFLVFTLLKTILGRQKMWTFTGPHFWIAGIFQILMGVVLTIGTAIIMTPGFLEKMGATVPEMMKGLSGSIVTSMFVPSIFVLIMIPLTIIYLVFKHKVKVELKNKKASEQAAQ